MYLNYESSVARMLTTPYFFSAASKNIFLIIDISDEAVDKILDY